MILPSMYVWVTFIIILWNLKPQKCCTTRNPRFLFVWVISSNGENQARCQVYLVVTHNCRHYNECIKRTLFQTPFAPAVSVHVKVLFLSFPRNLKFWESDQNSILFIILQAMLSKLTFLCIWIRLWKCLFLTHLWAVS